MESDRISEVFCSLPKVMQNKVSEIMTSTPEQSDNINCSVVPKMRNSPIPISQVVADRRRPFARGFSREFDQFLNNLHPLPLLQQ